MPHTASAKKRLRQSEKRHEQNKAAKSRLATLRRKFLKTVEAGNVEQAKTELREVQKAYDQAGAKHTVHKKTAGRKISRLYTMLENAKTAKAGGTSTK